MSESESKSIKKAQKLQNKLSKSELLEDKFKLEEQLKEIREQYGNLPEKKPEPKSITQCRWNYVLNEMIEMQQYMSKRLEFFKFKSKKLSEQAINKRQKYYEAIKEKERNEEKNQFRQLQRVSKMVYREFWKYVWQIRKQVQQFREDKIKQEAQKQKLGDIVSRLKEVTEEIGVKLAQYQNQQQEEDTLSIPIEKYKTLYFELKKRQNVWPGQKKTVQQVQSNIVIDLIKIDDDHYEIAKVEAKVEEKEDEAVLNADKLISILKKSKQFPFLFEAEDSLLEQQPYLLCGQLRVYQLVGVHWMASLHQQQMNGILADEMGLGKTIQTIALLAYLAANKQIWGPHLVIVPTSILMNWEIEFKRWCPAFKIMTYFGSPKERKAKRQGWSQLNSFHVCITSYKIVIQDSKVFKRKKWYYMILDEAQHIKNFKSQRWQVLLNFNTRSRLLLTGTPLQNDLGEIWSLLHFLMPSIFDSHQDFLQWFMSIEKAIQDNKCISEEVLRQLHDILRPFVLRRLKKDVEKQLPEKREVIVKCDLSRRQKYLYDEFIQSSGNFEIQGTDFVAMMNKVQQLRKVCNHPELFEQRPVEQPFLFSTLKFTFPKLIVIDKKWVPLSDLTYSNFRFPSQQVLQYYISILELQGKQIKTSKLGQRWQDIENTNLILRFKSNMQKSFRNLIMYHALLTYDPLIMAVNQKQVENFLMPTVEYLLFQMEDTLNEFSCVIRKVDARPPQIYFSPYQGEQVDQIPKGVDAIFPIIQKQRMLFPNKKLLIYDCGKMNTLVQLIYKLKSQNHKIIIFTQMTKMLDLFEAVLSLSKISYLRLDGSTPVEMRQKIVERFNQLNITCFISSTRSGGIGLNLTGADTVIFYDTDWNPAMDKQAQDRCHRIGQVRPVTIYRLITTSTIEENIFLKSLQKRQLDDFVMQSGMFSPEQILKSSQLFLDDERMDQAIRQVEDVDDRQAAQKAMIEEQNYQMNGAEEIQEIENNENNDWLIISQLPPIVKYGLQMSDCIIQDNAEIQQQQEELEQEEEEEEEEEEESNQIHSEEDENEKIDNSDDNRVEEEEDKSEQSESIKHKIKEEGQKSTNRLNRNQPDYKDVYQSDQSSVEQRKLRTKNKKNFYNDNSSEKEQKQKQKKKKYI